VYCVSQWTEHTEMLKYLNLLHLKQYALRPTVTEQQRSDDQLQYHLNRQFCVSARRTHYSVFTSTLTDTGPNVRWSAINPDLGTEALKGRCGKSTRLVQCWPLQTGASQHHVAVYCVSVELGLCRGVSYAVELRFNASPFKAVYSSHYPSIRLERLTKNMRNLS
jgi:hypothetical protein